jgi:methyl-accepting chemotaxis protein
MADTMKQVQILVADAQELDESSSMVSSVISEIAKGATEQAHAAEEGSSNMNEFSKVTSEGMLVMSTLESKAYESE